MARKPKSSLEKVTINIVRGNKETLGRFYPAMGWSVAARKVLDKFCARLEELDSQSVKADSELPDVEIDVEDIVVD